MRAKEFEDQRWKKSVFQGQLEEDELAKGSKKQRGRNNEQECVGLWDPKKNVFRRRK